MDEPSGCNDPLANYLVEDDPPIKKALGEKRQQRRLRQLGLSPPYIILNRRVFYPIAGFRQWLEANTRQPVRTRPQAHVRRRGAHSSLELTE
jgi:hypothetical protein